MTTSFTHFSTGGLEISGGAGIDPPSNLFNPWRDAQPPGHIRPEPERAPDQWYQLSQTAAGAIGAAGQATMLEYPERHHVGDRNWLTARTQDRLVALRTAGNAPAAKALAELQTAELNNSQLISHMIGKFLEARSVLAWLEAERARFDARIHRLKPFVEQGEAT